MEISPDHYGDWVVGDFITERNLSFYEGCVVKYVDRWRKKDGRKDLVKAREYIDKMISDYDRHPF
jgi:hypothetical protein